MSRRLMALLLVGFHPAYRDCCFSPNITVSIEGDATRFVSIPPTGIVAFLRGWYHAKSRVRFCGFRFHPAYRDCCFSPIEEVPRSGGKFRSFHPAYRDCCFSPVLWRPTNFTRSPRSFHPAYRDCCFSPKEDCDGGETEDVEGFHPAYRDCCFSPKNWGVRGEVRVFAWFPSRLPGLLLFSECRCKLLARSLRAGFHPAYRDCCFSPARYGTRISFDLLSTPTACTCASLTHYR